MNVDRRAAKSQKRNNKRKKEEECLKVVYISSPMKVKTSASQFRSLVQQLTGKHSDISQYMCRGDDFHEIADCCDDELHESNSLAKLETTSDIDRFQKLSSISPNDTPTSSDYSLGHNMDNVFGGIFSSDSFYDPSQMDVLGSFDELL